MDRTYSLFIMILVVIQLCVHKILLHISTHTQYGKQTNHVFTYIYKYVYGVKQDYAKGNYELGNDKIMILIHKYKDTGIKTQFIADMYISYLNICSVLNITYPYFGILDNIVKSPSDYSLSEQFINFIQDIYCRSLLSRKIYIQAEKQLLKVFKMKSYSRRISIKLVCVVGKFSC